MNLIPKNVLGEPLVSCCKFPMTGFFRDGYCRTCEDDLGKHVVCIICTKEFLEFSKQVGNNLSTPMPQFDFPGLIPGDRWCLCAERWLEAYENGKAPNVILEATEYSALEIIELKALKEHAVSPDINNWVF